MRDDDRAGSPGTSRFLPCLRSELSGRAGEHPVTASRRELHPKGSPWTPYYLVPPPLPFDVCVPSAAAGLGIPRSGDPVGARADSIGRTGRCHVLVTACGRCRDRCAATERSDPRGRRQRPVGPSLRASSQRQHPLLPRARRVRTTSPCTVDQGPVKRAVVGATTPRFTPPRRCAARSPWACRSRPRSLRPRA